MSAFHRDDREATQFVDDEDDDVDERQEREPDLEKGLVIWKTIMDPEETRRMMEKSMRMRFCEWHLLPDDGRAGKP